MLDVIVTAFVVFAIFAVVFLLLTVYVWRADPHQFAMWRAALRATRPGGDASTSQSAGSARPGTWKLRAPTFGGLRSEAVSEPIAPVPPVTTSGKSAAARLQYWLEIGRDSRGAP
jgi:hypothetical protein